MCDNGGYFCCLPGFTCYSWNEGKYDGCGEPGYMLGDGEIPLSTVTQVNQMTSTTGAASQSSPTTQFSESSSGSSATSATASTPSTEQSSTPASSSQGSSGKPSSGLSTDGSIAVGIGAPMGIATIVAAYYTARTYHRKYHSKS